MLLTKELYIKVSKNMCKYYKDKGYDCKYNDIILVKIEDLPKQSNKKVEVMCDNCGYIYKLSYCDYTKKIGLCVCKKCKHIKYKETCLKKYGVDNSFKVKEHQDKQKNTILQKYGVENVFQNEEIKDKIKETIIKKYNVEHIMHNEEIKKIVFEKSNNTKYKNNNQQTSKQQRYLHKLYGGELNYLYENLWLDIFFPDKNIYCEYNGSGHDISVKYHKITQEEFNIKEIKRYKFLRSNNLKQFLIISKKDYLPNIEILYFIKDFAFYILKSHNYIIFDIDKNIIKYDNICIQYNYTKTTINNAIVTTV